MCFNDKIRNICKDMLDLKFVPLNQQELMNFLNDKFNVRKYLEKIVPILEYNFVLPSIDYDTLVSKTGAKKMVLQASNGAGGENTYLIQNENDLLVIKGYLKEKYCVSKYVNNTPLNATLIIFEDDIIILPISAQLIKIIDNKFRYVGADFSVVNTLNKCILKKINNYSKKIGKKIQNLGYRGIMGIDYILTNDKIYFMEINPRFQSSSFLLSLVLKKEFNSSIAELNYMALKGEKSIKLDLKPINKSFLNCNGKQSFKNFVEDSIVKNGYYKKNSSSFYRKIFNGSIIDNNCFEKLDN